MLRRQMACSAVAVFILCFFHALYFVAHQTGCRRFGIVDLTLFEFVIIYPIPAVIYLAIKLCFRHRAFASNRSCLAR